MVKVKECEKVIEVLNTLLADEFVLYVKARNFHWNVVGPNFQELHKFFEEIYSEIETQIDDTAERVRTLGGRPLSSMGEFLERTRLVDSSQSVSAEEMLEELEYDYRTMIQNIDQAIKEVEEYEDVGSEDYLTGLLQDYEKKAWMISSMRK